MSASCLQCRYVPEYLAVGEAPDQVRNCFQQRSRWCKVRFPANHADPLAHTLHFAVCICRRCHRQHMSAVTGKVTDWDIVLMLLLP